MKAIAVFPGKKQSIHLRDVPKPTLADFDNERGVLVKVLKVGVDATDREINDALYGAPPPTDDFLITGHELFGQVVEVGSKVRHVTTGDFVACTVRRPGQSIYDRIGRSDITDDETYFERGINLLHGFLTEYIVDDVEFIVKIPANLKHLHVLVEPMSVAVKAIEQAYEAQKRLQVWEPRVAFVTGAGQIGLLATLALRLRGLEVYTIARGRKPNLKAEIAESYGAHYVSTKDTSIQELAKKTTNPDLIIEATGHSGVAFELMEVLTRNGAMVWTSVTGGTRTIEIPSDTINLNWVLGNKLLLGSVNSNYRHFEKGIADLAFAEATFPKVTQRILSNPVNGLENFTEMMSLLVDDPDALKVFINVADETHQPLET